MTSNKTLHGLLLANVTVLITHQIDSAFWHEWDLFHIPGGNQVNLLLNLPIIALVVFAYGVFVSAGRNAVAYYKLVAGLGFLTVVIHSFFFIAGSDAFIQFVSIGLLVATFVLSTLQLLAIGSKRSD